MASASAIDVSNKLLGFNLGEKERATLTQKMLQADE
jgi:hypothetical protein